MDYELTLTIKNAPLLNLMRARGYQSIAALSKASGVNRSSIDPLAKLSSGVYMQDDVTPKPSCVRLAEFLGVHLEELAPPSHLRSPLRQSSFTAQIAENQMNELAQSAQNPERLLEVFQTESRDAFEDMLESTQLSARERKVLRLRFKEEKTFEESGRELGVSRERIRQIEAKSLRKLRQYSRISESLVDSAGIYADGFDAGIKRTKKSGI